MENRNLVEHYSFAKSYDYPCDTHVKNRSWY